jgi:hypothetical protein
MYWMEEARKLAAGRSLQQLEAVRNQLAGLAVESRQSAVHSVLGFENSMEALLHKPHLAAQHRALVDQVVAGLAGSNFEEEGSLAVEERPCRPRVAYLVALEEADHIAEELHQADTGLDFEEDKALYWRAASVLEALPNPEPALQEEVARTVAEERLGLER